MPPVGRRAQLPLDGGQLVGERGDQPAGQHPGGGQRLGPLAQRGGGHVVAAEDQVGEGRQGGAAQLGQLGDAAGRPGQPGPQGERPDDAGGRDRAARPHQPDTRTHGAPSRREEPSVQ